MTRHITIGCGLFILAIASASAPAQTVIHVDAAADQSPHDGSDWRHAYLELYEALAAARSDPNIDTIRCADGTYRPDAGGLVDPRLATFQLLDGVTLEGGYAGCGAADPDERDLVLHETILSGDLNGDDSGGAGISENCYHVVTGSGTDATAVLDGFAVTAGNADGENPFNRGAGMFNDDGNPTLNACRFRANAAAERGGGMYNWNSSSPTLTNCIFSGNSAAVGGGMANMPGGGPTLIDCTFSENSGRSYCGGVYNQQCDTTLIRCVFNGNSGYVLGGGIYIEQCNPTLTDCAFSGNSAHYGGGLYSDWDSNPMLIRCTFRGNSVNSFGGGAYIENGDPMVAYCTFSGNSAVDMGGGMFIGGGAPTVTHCTFSGNSTLFQGGAMWSGGVSSLTLTNCTFTGNSTRESGGGMYCEGSSPTLTNCTFSCNSAEVRGGGLYAESGGPTLTNCTFSGNLATDHGGGMGIENGFSTLTNCIFWSNASPTCPQIYYGSNATALTHYSCIQGGWAGIGNINANPLLDHALRPVFGSPCIDAGNNAALPPDATDLDGDGDTTEPCPLDLDGHPRFHDDPATADTGVGSPPIVDMGACEYQSVQTFAGACCLGDFCIVATESACLAAGGEYRGAGTNCETAECPTSLIGDLDHDCDVDLADLAELLGHYGEVCGG